MKNFEEKFDVDEGGNGGDCDCECCGIPITCEECKVIAEYWYRQALEFAQEQLTYDRAPCEGIEQELGDEQ